MWIIIVLVILFGFSRGIKEGMVMLLPSDPMCFNAVYHGAKGHRWFRWYHAISAVPFIVLAFLVWQYLEVQPSIFYTLAAFVLMWEVTEMGESFARYIRLIPDREKVVFLDIFDFDLHRAEVIFIHALRLVGSFLIFWKGWS